MNLTLINVDVDYRIEAIMERIEAIRKTYMYVQFATNFNGSTKIGIYERDGIVLSLYALEGWYSLYIDKSKSDKYDFLVDNNIIGDLAVELLDPCVRHRSLHVSNYIINEDKILLKVLRSIIKHGYIAKGEWLL